MENTKEKQQKHKHQSHDDKTNNKDGCLQYMGKEAQVSSLLFDGAKWEMLSQLLLDQSRNFASGKENRQTLR